jgi:predicted aldo/keto reductase-like oxidoreductase
VVLTAYNCLQDHREQIREAIAYAAAAGVGVVAMKTQGGVKLNQDSEVETNHRASLKWVLADKNVCTTIPGMTNFDQLELNLGVMSDPELTVAERRDLQITAARTVRGASPSGRGSALCGSCR